MRVNKYLMPAVVLVVLLGTVAIAQATGNFVTSGKGMVDLANLAPEDIKGWMTWQNISDGFAIPVEELYALLNVPADIPPSTAIKDMETLLEGFETSDVREALAAYLGVPYTAEGEAAPSGSAEQATAIPTPVATSAAPTVAPQPAQIHVPQGDGSGEPAGDGTGPTPLPSGQILSASDIKGRHTLAEIAQQCAVPLDQLYVALNLPADFDSTTQISSLTSLGLVAEVQAVRDAVAALQADSGQ